MPLALELLKLHEILSDPFPMEKPIGKIERQNHLNHMNRIVPIIAVLFGVQCFMIFKLTGGQFVGDYALFLGVSLACFIMGMSYYDNNHHVIIFHNKLRVIFELTGFDQEYFFDDIQDIITAGEDATFSSMTLVMKDESRHTFYFVDYPFFVKKMILDLKENKQSQNLAA